MASGLRPDHVPTVRRDSNDRPRISFRSGRLYAIGYIRGLPISRRRSPRGCFKTECRGAPSSLLPSGSGSGCKPTLWLATIRAPPAATPRLRTSWRVRRRAVASCVPPSRVHPPASLRSLPCESVQGHQRDHHCGARPDPADLPLRKMKSGIQGKERAKRSGHRNHGSPSPPLVTVGRGTRSDELGGAPGGRSPQRFRVEQGPAAGPADPPDTGQRRYRPASQQRRGPAPVPLTSRIPSHSRQISVMHSQWIAS